MKEILISAILQFHFPGSHLLGWIGWGLRSGQKPARRKRRMFEKPGQARHYPAAHSQPRKNYPAARAVCSLRPCWDALPTLESPPIGRRGNGSRSGAVNPEVLRGRGPGDSFEWNRADSSPVRGARVGSSLSPCRRRRRRRLRRRVPAAGRQGSRPRPPVPPARR